jgi:DNA-binding transcriptional LysR family regulator
MDTTRWRYLITVAETENLKIASELLRVSSPALSKSLRVLEEEFSCKLIVPNGRGILITDEGKKLAKKLSLILNELDKIKSHDHTEQKNSRLGTFEVFSTYFFGELAAEYPDSHWQLFELIPGEIEDALIKNHIDIGISYIPIPMEGLDYLKIGKVHMNVFGTNHWGNKTYDANDLPFAIPISPLGMTPTKVRGLDGWNDDKVKRQVKFQVTLLESALELCRINLAVGYFPEFIIDLHNKNAETKKHLHKIKMKQLPKNTTHDVYLIKRKTDVENDLMKKTAKILRRHLS